MREADVNDAPCHFSLEEAEAWVSGYNSALTAAIEACASVIEKLPPGFGDLNRNDVAARIRALAPDSDDRTNAGTDATGAERC